MTYQVADGLAINHGDVVLGMEARLEACLKTLPATAERVIRQVIVVAHEQGGPNPSLHSVIKTTGATAPAFDVRATAPERAEILAEQISREEVGVTRAVMRYPSAAGQA